MFGSRKDDDKTAKRRIWPWGRRDEQGQLDETAEQPSQKSGEADVEPVVDLDTSVGQPSGESKEPVVTPEKSVPSTEKAKEQKQPRGQEQAKPETAVQEAQAQEGKLGLFARMRQKFDKHPEDEPGPVEKTPSELDNIGDKTKNEPNQEVLEKADAPSEAPAKGHPVEPGLKPAVTEPAKPVIPESVVTQEPLARKESLTSKEPSAKKESSVKKEQGAAKEPSAKKEPSTTQEQATKTVSVEKPAPAIKSAEPKVSQKAESSSQAVATKPASDIAAVNAVNKPEKPEDKPVQTALDDMTEAPVKGASESKPAHQDAAQEVKVPVDDQPQAESGGFFARMRKGLNKTRSVLVEGVTELFIGKKEIDDDLLEELETQLLVADVGVEATSEIIEKLTERVKYKELDDADALIEALKVELRGILEPADKPLVISEQKKPYVILVVGVNGVGKTTTIGKIASKLQQQGKSVMLAAGDTFRAAAVEQLQVWGERNRIPVIGQHTGADSASVIYDAFEAAKARGADVLIADTAGRLHNKENLMEELKKVRRVLGKLDTSAPHEVLLVLDAGTGQNALSQAKLFHESVGLTGMALTKLDGTAKGGVIFALSRQMQLPIRFLGVGEQIDDLRPFVANEFVDALFSTKE